MSGSRHKAIKWRALAILVLVLLAQLALTSVSSASGGSCVHIVQCGDTLFSIARRFGTTVSAIAQANGICNPNLIFVGQRLIIPCPCPSTCTTVCPTVDAVCEPQIKKDCVTVDTVCKPEIKHCPPSCIYIVQPCDTLTRIAARFGTTVFELIRLNGICNPNLIFVGQRLRVC